MVVLLFCLRNNDKETKPEHAQSRITSQPVQVSSTHGWSNTKLTPGAQWANHILWPEKRVSQTHEAISWVALPRIPRTLQVKVLNGFHIRLEKAKPPSSLEYEDTMGWDPESLKNSNVELLWQVNKKMSVERKDPQDEFQKGGSIIAGGLALRPL